MDTGLKAEVAEFLRVSVGMVSEQDVEEYLQYQEACDRIRDEIGEYWEEEIANQRLIGAGW